MRAKLTLDPLYAADISLQFCSRIIIIFCKISLCIFRNFFAIFPTLSVRLNTTKIFLPRMISKESLSD